MSASAWDRAVEAAAIIEAERHQVDIKRGGCTCGFCAWSADHVAIYAVRAAIPVLLEELAQRIEGEVAFGFAAARIVREFAAEIVRGSS